MNIPPSKGIGVLGLQRLVYTSAARADLTLNDVRDIRRVSARRNYFDAIRGKLYFTGEAFLQILEGDEAALAGLMADIDGDPRHHTAIIHSRRSIDQHCYADWMMDIDELWGQPEAIVAQIAAQCPSIHGDELAGGITRLHELGASRASWATERPPNEAMRLVAKFEDWVKAIDYPCVGAKSAIGRRQMNAYIGRSITSSWDDLAIASEIIRFAHRYHVDAPLFQTFVAFFPDTPSLSEKDFEVALWQRVQSLQQKDIFLGQQPDRSVSSDPADPNFSLSFGGQSFFIVGLHPHASRPARRFEVPALVFNLHDQFVRLRADGRYEGMRSTILGRDEALAGDINPMLARHGEISEARQYSGRLVGPDWQCPYPGRDLIEQQFS